MLYIIAGTRPNFVKIAPLIWEFNRRKFKEWKLIHSGQHYDYLMNQVFFEQLDIPEPDWNLGVGSGTHAYQTGHMMMGIEKICLESRPDMIVVVGDVNCTLAGALVGAKLHIPVVHIESGLRSGDRKMPEEINRIITDHVSNHLFVTEQSGLNNLVDEGIDRGAYFVGNIITDTIEKKRHLFGEMPGEFALVTIHRPENVDDRKQLKKVIGILNMVAKDYIDILFPVHPRTKEKLKGHDLHESIQTLDPMSYFGFMGCLGSCKAVLTDSGGIQEESTYLGIPCLTLRDSTERPVTVKVGTNTICETKKEVAHYMEQIMDDEYKRGAIPELWDGGVAKRIAEVLL